MGATHLLFHNQGRGRPIGGASDIPVNLENILHTQPASLIAVWPGNDASAPTVYDKGVNGYNALAVGGVTFGSDGIGDGGKSLLLDGTTGYVNLYSAGLAGAFNASEGTVLVFVKVKDATVWSDASERYFMRLRATSQNRIDIFKRTNVGWVSIEYVAGGTNSGRIVTNMTQTSFFSVAITWSVSNDRVRAYKDGVQQGATLTGLGTWEGALLSTLTLMGAGGAGAWVHNGSIAYGAIWSVELSPTEVATVGSPF